MCETVLYILRELLQMIVLPYRFLLKRLLGIPFGVLVKSLRIS